MKSINIEPLTQEHLNAAAALFMTGYEELHASVPSLPDEAEKKKQVTAQLAQMIMLKRGIAATSGSHLIGYLTWVIADNLRSTGRTGAYCPEWAHAASRVDSNEIYLALYREAAKYWSTADCTSHAFTYLVNDHAVEHFLYWNGFGLICVDSIRTIHMQENNPQARQEIRKADKVDAPLIASLDEEHWRHYARPTIYMAANNPSGVEKIERFLESPRNSYWLAEVDGEPAAFFRVEGVEAGNILLVQSETTIAITGAFTRPQVRGRGLATAVLKAVLQDYAGRGYERCSVDYESINPEASAYWRKHFTPVCFSAIRYPEIFLKE